MQLDFHHAVTYLCARLAGYPVASAEIIAYAAQYVDDAVDESVLCFTSGARFARIATAHDMIDLKNMNYEDGLKVWQPFHFLAGNNNLPAGTDPAGKFIEKLICRPNSVIARDMVRAAFDDIKKPYALHRLGIAMHVYADTWAHQGFAGVLHPVNAIDSIQTPSSGTVERFLDLLKKAAPPVGHAQAGVLPDMPFLQWKYKNGRNETVTRDNTALFCDAADNLCKWMERFRLGDPDAEVRGIDSANRMAIKTLFTKNQEIDENKRQQAWLNAMGNGATFVLDGKGIAEKPAYPLKGARSWMSQALGTDNKQDSYVMKEAFATSNWKYFHDAAQAHRFDVMHEILPAYGIFVG